MEKIATAIVGGGAAGFFLAVNLKELCPEMDVVILERSHKVLAKVEVSGGGRCNCTNTFRDVRDLKEVYPRGHQLMKRLMKGFSQRDAYKWFEQHGVPLTVQEDQCVFPVSQDSHSIIDCLTTEARRLGVEIRLGEHITSIDQLADYDFIAVTTGGSPQASGLQWLADAGHEIVKPVPSLFSLRVDDDRLHSLMGIVVDPVTTLLSGTKMRAEGALLITHWGLSGPAILKLSSYAARQLSEQDYHTTMAVNWTMQHDSEVAELLAEHAIKNGRRQIRTSAPCSLTTRLWEYLADKHLRQRSQEQWNSVSRKELNRIANVLSGGDTYAVSGRAPFKDEFVTCGGIALSSITPSTLESRHRPRLYFAGEVLDIDGITGGFNFQAAWTTAYTVAHAIAQQAAGNQDT